VRELSGSLLQVDIMALGLGIDTGGTYTDSVIIDLASGEVLRKAKALTTRDDLSRGVANSIGRLDRDLFDRIGLVSVSSTLATNSVVEGKGCRVGLIIIGGDFRDKIPVEGIVRVAGGHDLNGEEVEELRIEEAEEFVRRVRDKVDSIAVSGYLSVRNPEHEVRVRSMVSSLCPLPVVTGHELSSKLGFRERTVTAVLNARLIPIIAELVESVKKILASHGICAPLMIMRGNGSIMAEAMALERPVETILSGPAASLTGARFLTSLDDAVVIDMGGTTTDIGILRDGKPRLDPDGATIGGWRTRVRAIDVLTSGIGGDSRIVVTEGRVFITPQRVVPLCIAATEHPGLKAKLRAIEGKVSLRESAYLDVDRIVQSTDFFIFSRNLSNFPLGESERRIVDLIRDEPRSLPELGEMMGIPPLTFSIKRLEEFGIIQRIGVTPTDILHADGEYVEYDREASKLAVGIHSRRMEMEPGDFCKEVKTSVLNRISRELLRKLLYEETGETEGDQLAEHIIGKFITGERGIDYSCSLRLNKSIIGIGAPVGSYLPHVAERFGTMLLMPEHMEVGNAVGAITGSVIEEVEMLIRPKPGLGGLEDPPCILHSPEEMREFESFSEALDHATIEGRRIAGERGAQSGACDIQIVVDRDDMVVKTRDGWGDDVLIETRLTVKAIGKPMQFFEC